ncbi:hypothetical protein [Mycobacterium palustre]|uniref:Uncharacterized protein n=1 Tax=Mycobacterium palustre TaxID=153971 RepID=A0A1X1YY73_9MYCO|nr:hypothetical protein [Mycobacterium palustre]MCV7101789.1 hypothetical protein [Mycobacterium palustre]ORW16037.1 hypothetical protein AWC19_23100 [Mycobacterium palustre]
MDDDQDIDDEHLELPDGRKLRITGKALEFLGDHDECPFCIGRAAAHRGEPEDSNPYPAVDVPEGSVDWYETDYGLWLAGHALGSTEPGGPLWHEQPNRS